MNDLVLRAALVDGVLVDIGCADGRVVSVDPAGTGPAATSEVDADGRLVFAAPAEPHAHLDKAFTADLVANPAGDLEGAIVAWKSHYDDRSRPEIAARAERAIRRLASAGSTAVRTHVDCGPAIGLQAVEALVELRERYAPVIEVQVCALVAPPTVGAGSEGALERLDRAIEAGIDVVGGVPYAETDIRRATAQLLERAAGAGLPVDFHTDETLDPDVLGLLDLAELAADFPHPVAASHCCSLGMNPPERQAEVAAAVAEAGIHVITLPQTNLFLQSRDRPSAPPRGLTAVGALLAAGANVAAGADNLQDPFNTVGRADPFETAALMVMVGHVDAETAWEMVSGASRSALGLEPAGPFVGAVADLLAVPSANVRAAVADAPSTRLVIRRGEVVSHTSEQWSGHPLLASEPGMNRG